MAEKKQPVEVGTGIVVVVSREQIEHAQSLSWPALVASADGEGIKVVETSTSDGQVNMVRPLHGFASLRCGDSGMLKGRPILFEQNW